MNEDRQALLQIYLQEYTSLKAEQTQRIGFRDNLLYVTLGAFGGILSFAVSNPANYFALLVLPWICLILGWTYLVNDEKISAISRYLRSHLADKLRECASGEDPRPTPLQGVPDRPDVRPIFGLESGRRGMRTRRKIQQLIREQMSDEGEDPNLPLEESGEQQRAMQSLTKELTLGWEVTHRSDRHRTRRKREQLIVDWIAFVFSGIASILAFWVLVPQPPFLVQLLSLGEFALLMVLGIEIFVYADWQEGK